MLNIKPLLKNKIINLTPIIEGCEFYAIATIANETKNNIIYIARDEQRANAIFTACTWFITNRKILRAK